MQTRNYSQRSITTYVHMLHCLEEYFNTSIDEISIDQVKDFLQYSIETKKVSVSYINQVISAVRILQHDVLGKSGNQSGSNVPDRTKNFLLFCQRKKLNQ